MIAECLVLLSGFAGRAGSLVVGALLLTAAWLHLRARGSHASYVVLAIWGTLGLLGVAGGLMPWVWAKTFSLSYMAKIRLLMAGMSFVVLLIAADSIRHALLKERYALLWVVTGLLILLCAFEPRVLGWVSSTFGMQYVSTVVAVIFTFLLMVSFHFSISLSKLESKISKIAQRTAQLEARLELLERRDKDA
jgi:hypothetical protein